MPLNRRDFSAGWLGGVALLGAVPTASAQGKAPVEGVNYVRLEQPVPATVPGKIEVIEFFWYECPHCNAFEPALEAWEKALPADVVLHRVPVWFREEPFTAQQKLYYALDGMGLVPSMQRRVFYAIHNDHVRLRTAEDISAFALKNGIDPLKFMPIYNSFSVQTQAQRARQIAAAYKIDAVPAMGVQGRFYTNGSLASANGAVTTPTGTNERMLVVVDSLIARIRQGA
jgi:protein dithiol oxidoreductase (disulfide-forming)